jgi:hypothetical protein
MIARQRRRHRWIWLLGPLLLLAGILAGLDDRPVFPEGSALAPSELPPRSAP